MTRNTHNLCRCGSLKHEKSKRCRECYCVKRPYGRVGLMMKNKTFDKIQEISGECDNCKTSPAKRIFKKGQYCNGCFYNIRLGEKDKYVQS